MLDPFTMGLILSGGGQNPEQVGPILEQFGLTPEMVKGAIPGSAQGSTFTPAAPGELPWAPNGGAALPPGMPGAQQQPQQAQGYNPGLQGVKAPAPIQPIMNGGVTGGVRPPEVTAKMGQGSAAINALMAALLGGSKQATAVPTLGSYINQRG